MNKIDIAEQLRAYGHPARSASHKMALAAAAEIERLRELKEHARKCCDEADAEIARLRVLVNAPPPLDPKRHDHQHGHGDDRKLGARHSSSTSTSVREV